VHLSTAQAVPMGGEWTSSSYRATPLECASIFVGPYFATEHLVPMGAHLSTRQVVPTDGHVSAKFSCNHIFTEHARFELEKFCKTTELGHA